MDPPPFHGDLNLGGYGPVSHGQGLHTIAAVGVDGKGGTDAALGLLFKQRILMSEWMQGASHD